MASLERRLFERFEARFPTRFRDTSIDYGTDVFLKDASGTGARITTRQKMFIDDVVSLEVKMPDGLEPVVLNGRVRWVHQLMAEVWEVGVEFHRVDFMRMHRLVRYALSAQNN
ncbi:MAG: PilZ domain-containing protein [Candidatus Omnitrophica bacterium]|nr:PilZ domain-containing protein [Candidatus Omnitrophota bacterium]